MKDADLWAVLGQQTDWDRQRREWAKKVVLSLDLLNPPTVPKREDIVAYLCRLLYLLQSCTPRADHETWIEVDALRTTYASGLATCGIDPRAMRFHFRLMLQTADSANLIRTRHEDRWHPGMASGSGFVELVQLTPAGYRVAFPDDAGDRPAPKEAEVDDVDQEAEDAPLSVEECPAQNGGNPTSTPVVAKDRSGTTPDACGRTPLAESAKVKLFGPADNPCVNGQEMKLLTRPQYDVVLALIRAGDRGLTKDKLDAASGHGDARKVMKRLAKDPTWATVLVFAGVTGGGYRIL